MLNSTTNQSRTLPASIRKVRDKLFKFYRIILCLILFYAAPINQANAAKGGILIEWGGEKLIKVASFPNNEFYRLPSGEHLDAGYRYKQFRIFFVPLWNYEGNWCGYIGSEEKYLNLSKEELAELAVLSKTTLPDTPSLPFWDWLGGKLLLLSIIVAISLGARNHAEAT